MNHLTKQITTPDFRLYEDFHRNSIEHQLNAGKYCEYNSATPLLYGQENLGSEK